MNQTLPLSSSPPLLFSLLFDSSNVGNEYYSCRKLIKTNYSLPDLSLQSNYQKNSVAYLKKQFLLEHICLIWFHFILRAQYNDHLAASSSCPSYLKYLFFCSKILLLGKSWGEKMKKASGTNEGIS